jgi:hypothetical protein
MCTDAGCLAHGAYDHTKSSTFEELGLYIEVEFGTGEVDGEINSDTVTFGDISLPNQHIGEIVEEEGDIFVQGQFEVILGLAFASMAPEGITPLFDNLMEEGVLENN